MEDRVTLEPEADAVIITAAEICDVKMYFAEEVDEQGAIDESLREERLLTEDKMPVLARFEQISKTQKTVETLHVRLYICFPTLY
ncbi:MAG: hypothetical protein HC908_08395, partial [Calothrix sp. SM1_7_51]|nr:hypothetical protein [Calothrix sp. SM1_7_51]